MDISALLDKYGWWVTLGVIVLLNAKSIVGFIEKACSLFAPALSERIKNKRELVQRKLNHEYETENDTREAGQQERQDVIVMMKDLLKEYREERAVAEMQSCRANDEMIAVVRGYEKLSAQVVEVLRDIADAIRANTTHVDKLQEAMNERIANKT